MKRQIRAEKIGTSPKYLTVYVRVEVGSTVRFAQVKVPWRMLAGQYQNVMDGMEHVFAEEIARQHDVHQLRLPGID